MGLLPDIHSSSFIKAINLNLLVCVKNGIGIDISNERSLIAYQMSVVSSLSYGMSYFLNQFFLLVTLSPGSFCLLIYTYNVVLL